MTVNPRDPLKLVRRSKLFVPVNREKFVAKAWTRRADCIILDLEDSIPPAEKATARKLIKEAIPLVSKGGAEVQVRINREFEEEDLDAILFPGLTAVMIPKCEWAEEMLRLDRAVTRLEKERGIPAGKVQFDLIIETARGIVNMESSIAASPRIVQASVGEVDLTMDMGFIRSPDLNVDQFFYPSSRLLYAAKAAGVQASGLWPQNRGGFTDTSLREEVMLQVCRRSFQMGFLGSATIHPAWCRPINEGFKPSASELEFARKVKAALEDAYHKGLGSAAVDGGMVDVANMKHVQKILERADAIARREAEKEAALAAAEGSR